MLSRIICAILGHNRDHASIKIAYKPRLAGKSRYHVRVKGQKQFVGYGMSYKCRDCEQDLFEYYDNHKGRR